MLARPSQACEAPERCNHCCINELLTMLRHALRMSNQSAAANVHSFVRQYPPPETEDASDPVPIMRRQITLLNIEVEHLRAKEDEAREIKEILFAYVERVEQLRENRDEWQREAERLSAVMGKCRAGYYSGRAIVMAPRRRGDS